MLQNRQRFPLFVQNTSLTANINNPAQNNTYLPYAQQDTAKFPIRTQAQAISTTSTAGVHCFFNPICSRAKYFLLAPPYIGTPYCLPGFVFLPWKVQRCNKYPIRSYIVGKRTFALFSANESSNNKPKTTNFQAILPIRFSIRGRLQRCICFVFVFLKSERSYYVLCQKEQMFIFISAHSIEKGRKKN